MPEIKMPAPNMIGIVSELLEDAILDENNEVIPGKAKIRIKVKLWNTMGKERVIWVDGPEDLADFYSAELGK